MEAKAEHVGNEGERRRLLAAARRQWEHVEELDPEAAPTTLCSTSGAARIAEFGAITAEPRGTTEALGDSLYGSN